MLPVACRVLVMPGAVLPFCCYGKVIDSMINNSIFTKKTLDYKYVTDLSDYTKIGVVGLLKNRRIYGKRYIFNYLSQTRWSIEHTNRHTSDYSFTSYNISKCLEVQHLYTW